MNQSLLDEERNFRDNLPHIFISAVAAFMVVALLIVPTISFATGFDYQELAHLFAIASSFFSIVLFLVAFFTLFIQARDSREAHKAKLDTMQYVAQINENQMEIAKLLKSIKQQKDIQEWSDHSYHR